MNSLSRILGMTCVLCALPLFVSSLAAQPARPTRTPGPIAPQQAPAAPGQPAPELPAPEQPVPAAPGQPAPAPGLPPLEPGEIAVPPPPGAPLRREDEIVTANMLQLPATPLDQVFELYAEYSGRTVLRPTGLPQITITLRTQTDLTVGEVIQAFDAVLALNQITMIPFGEKFVKAVPVGQAHQEGTDISRLAPGEIPMADQFVTHVVRLATVKPSEIAPVFATFTKNPAGITPIDASNILILRDYASNIRRMLDVIEQVDVTPETDYTLEVIPIRYGKVSELFETMNALITGTAPPPRATRQPSGPATRQPTQQQYGRPTTGQPQFRTQQTTPGADRSAFQDRLRQIVSRAATGDQVEVLGDARIVPDERSNSLLVYSNRRDLAMIKNIVEQVDRLHAQVLIEAIIVEVHRGEDQVLGVSWLQNPAKAGDLRGGGAVLNHSLERMAAGREFIDTGGQSLAGPTSGFTYFARAGNTLEATITALAEEAAINVLSRPRIQTSHAVPAAFLIGQSVPYITGFDDFGLVGQTRTRTQVQEREVLFRLDVTPFITPDGLVVMEIQQTFDSLGTPVEIDDNPYPVINRREVMSTLSAQDGDTIMIGGFVTQNKSQTRSGVPILKDIPFLGAAFRSKRDTDERSELIVLIRPTVLASPQIAAVVAEEERMQLPGVSQAEMELEMGRRERLRAVEEQRRQFEERIRREESLGIR